MVRPQSWFAVKPTVCEIPAWVASDQERGWYLDSRFRWNHLVVALADLWTNWPVMPPPMKKDIIGMLRYLADWLENNGRCVWPAGQEYPEPKEIQPLREIAQTCECGSCPCSRPTTRATAGWWDCDDCLAGRHVSPNKQEAGLK